MSFIKTHKTDIFFVSLLGLITFILWWPTRELPYWWDSAGYIVHAARFYLDTNFSSFILPSDATISVFAHPPLFPFLLAWAWSAFGSSILVSHLFYLPFVFLAVLFCYLLGKELSNLVGFGAALLLLFTPLFVAHIGIIYVEIPVAAFALMTVYFFFRRNIVWYLISGSLMLFIKEVSVVIIGAILATLTIEFLLNVLWERKRTVGELKKFGKELALYASPLLLLVGWFVWHKASAGWLFTLPSYQSRVVQEGWSISLSNIKLVFRFFFWEQFRWVATVLLGTLLFILATREEMPGLLRGKRREILILLSLIVFAAPLLFGKLEFLPRYLIFGLPFFFLLFSFVLGYALRKNVNGDRRVASKRIVFLAMTIALALLFTFEWDNHQGLRNWRFAPVEENLEYIDIIRVGKQMAQFVQQKYADARVYTAFPSSYMLAEPFQGYVSKPVKVVDCNKYTEGDRVDLIVFHLLSPPQIWCRDLIQKLKFVPGEGFAHNGKWMQLYVPPRATNNEQ